MIRAFLLVALTVFASGAAQAQAQEAPPTREALTVFAEDALAANQFDDDLEAQTFAVTGAFAWLLTASFESHQLGEALMHARAVAAGAEAALPDLRVRLAGFGDDVPSFPPVFYWVPEWKTSRQVSLDWLEADVGYLMREVAALETGDWEALQEARAGVAQDGVAFQAYSEGLTQSAMERLPEAHPERHLFGVFMPFAAYYQLEADRTAAVDESARRELTLEIMDVVHDAVGEMEASIAAFEASLPPFAEEMRPLADILAGDAAGGAVLVEQTLESYARSADYLRTLVSLYRESNRLNAAYWRDGLSPELVEAFDRVGSRVSEVNRAYFQEWTKRAEVLHAAASR